MIAILLSLCFLPTPTMEDRWSCDLIVLNHTQSKGRQYTQLVMIDDEKIINVEWQPSFGTGKPQRWMLMSQVSDFYLITVTGYYGDLETWKTPRFIETRTENNNWMKQFLSDEEP
ncbi:hypothetical protein [Candidatus Laterigemmans baculatus]|uniref:hypothetical protein n=1 Tax=Candidatus Laterigemmans baculatus TaxID=2770505 RepID=UPI0013DD7927|nr:hypothetical protein [Candidatus Laterigemmans baculatus]